MTCPHKKKGFTLVEVVVTAILTSIAGIALVTIFGMFYSQQRESLVMLRLQTQYEELRQEISVDTHKAAWVNITGSRPSVPIGQYNTNTTVVAMIYNNGTTIGNYSISGTGFLKNGTTFFTSQGPLLLETGATFSLSRFRDKLHINNLTIKKVKNSETFIYSPRSEVFSCRNWEF